MKKIIGITAVALSGKDTAANAIKEYTDNNNNNNNNTDIFAFAEPLKQACKILFNLSHDQLYDPILKEKIDDRWQKSPRQIMQLLGNIIRTQIDQDFFLVNMKQRIESSKAKYIVISDVRFDNEVEFIKSLGGKIIKIERNSETTVHSDDVSEAGISSNLIDAIIKNNSSIQEFKTNVILCLNILIED